VNGRKGRARAVANGTGDKRIVNGILVSTVPVLTSLVFTGIGGIDIYAVKNQLLKGLVWYNFSSG